MHLNQKSETRLDLVQAAEKHRNDLETHLLQASGELKSLFSELQTYLIELEFQSEELRRSNDELTKLHRQYVELYEQAPLGYLVFSSSGIVLDVNPACLNLLGAERNRVVGRSFGRFVQAEWSDKFFRHLAHTLENGKKNSIELKIFIDANTDHYVLMESIPAQAQGASSSCIYSVVVDIGERYRFLDKLHASEENFRLLFNEMAGGAMVIDVIGDESGNPVDALIVDVNPAFTDLTGIARENAVGRRILEALPETEKYWFEALADAPRLGKRTSIEAYHRQLGKYYHLTAFRLAHGHIVVTGMDVTEQKINQESLREAKEALEDQITARTAELTASIQALRKQIEKRRQAEKDSNWANTQLRMRAGQLRELTGELTMAEHRERRRLSKVLHDGVQQHLVSARMRMEIVRDEVGEGDLKYEMDKASELIDDSIQMVRSLSVSLSPPVLQTEGLEAGLKWLAQWMQEKHNFKVDLHLDDAYPLSKDVLILVFESVRELLFNAAKHARAPGALVRLQRIEGDRMQLSVRDEGVGFDLHRLSAPADKDKGLGLFSVRHRINLIGGEFHIDSVLGKGSCFTMVIPCGTDSA